MSGVRISYHPPYSTSGDPHPHALVVLRHGETDWNAEGRMQGRLDSPLTTRGIAQARAQHAILAGMDLVGYATWTSPQPRALRTADIALADHVVPRTDDRLCEIGMGAWEGRRLAEVLAERPELETLGSAFDHYDLAPKGEGFAALEARCRDWLAAQEGPAMVVTHGMTSRMLRALALTGTPDLMTELPGGQGVVHVVEAGRHRTLEDGSVAVTPDTARPGL